MSKETKRDKEYRLEQSRTIGSHFRAMHRWHAILSRVRKDSAYQHVKILITREEFIAWFRANDWDGCTVDRIDPKGHYEFSNMRLISLSENSRRAVLTFTDTHGTCNKCRVTMPIELFRRHCGNINGRANTCAECTRRLTREYLARKRAISVPPER
jgi:hypothetical protein